MGVVSVAQAAERLGVGVSRIHQRIADGSLSAERVGAQWVVDELSVLRVQERRSPGRPLSSRSAWGVIAASEGDRDWIGRGGSVQWSRAVKRLEQLLAAAERPIRDEIALHDLSRALRSVFRNRAERQLLRVAPADLDDLRGDDRWAATVSTGLSGIASPDLEGYMAAVDLGGVREDYLLVEAGSEANVVLHVLPDGQHPYPDSRLRLAADLADHRGPREEARAAELLHELASESRARR